MVCNVSKSFLVNGAMVLIMLLTLTSTGVAAPESQQVEVPQSYDCVTYGPCYGGNFWQGATYGAYSYIYVKGVYCSECYLMGRRFDHRIYLSDLNGGTIEVGYGARNYDTYFYWMNRPPGQGELRYDIERVPDQYRNQYMRFKLSRNLRAWNQVHVNITSDYGACCEYNWVNVATNSMGGGNSWLALEIDAGAILEGYNGATSYGYISWQRNAWQTNDGVYHWQTNPGNDLFRHPGSSINPIYPEWVQRPSEATQGGWFRISCYC